MFFSHFLGMKPALWITHLLTSIVSAVCLLCLILWTLNTCTAFSENGLVVVKTVQLTLSCVWYCRCPVSYGAAHCSKCSERGSRSLWWWWLHCGHCNPLPDWWGRQRFPWTILWGCPWSGRRGGELSRNIRMQCSIYDFDVFGCLIFHIYFNALLCFVQFEEELPADLVLNFNDMIPEKKSYYTWLGSFTTPPCTEGVTWILFDNMNTVSARQVNYLLMSTSLFCCPSIPMSVQP